MEIIYNGTNTLNRKRYQCNYCNEVFVWNNKSSWYGSYYDLEMNPNKIKYYCCKDHYIKDNNE